MEKAGISTPMLVWIGVSALNATLIPVIIGLLRASDTKRQFRITAWSYSLFWSFCCGLCFWLAWNSTPRDYFVMTYSVIAFIALLLMVVLFQLDKREVVRKKRRNF